MRWSFLSRAIVTHSSDFKMFIMKGILGIECGNMSSEIISLIYFGGLCNPRGII